MLNNSPSPSPSPSPADVMPTPDLHTPEDADILTDTAFMEASSEGREGMQAVCNVVMNRVALADKHPHFGDGTVKGACMAPMQFSCWNKGEPNQARRAATPHDDPVLAMARSLALMALAGGLDDITSGATYYYADSIPIPKWAEGKTPCKTIGQQIFFNNIA